MKREFITGAELREMWGKSSLELLHIVKDHIKTRKPSDEEKRIALEEQNLKLLDVERIGWELPPFNEFGEISCKKSFLLVCDNEVLIRRRSEGRGGQHIDEAWFRTADVTNFEAAHPELKLYQEPKPPKPVEPDRVGKSVIAYRIALERGAVKETRGAVREEIAKAIGTDKDQIRRYVTDGKEYVDYLIYLTSKSKE